MGISLSEDDSPLAFVSSIDGILTLLAAVGAAVWLQIHTARQANEELMSLMRTVRRYQRETEIQEEAYHFKVKALIRRSDVRRDMHDLHLQGRKIYMSVLLVFRDNNRTGWFLADQDLLSRQQLEFDIYCRCIEAFFGAKDLIDFFALHGLEDWISRPAERDSSGDIITPGYPSVRLLPPEWPRKGYTLRWLRLRPQIRELINRRDELVNNRMGAILLNIQSQMEANEKRARKQRKMVKDIWKMLKAQAGEVAAGESESSSEESDSAEGVPGNAPQDE